MEPYLSIARSTYTSFVVVADSPDFRAALLGWTHVRSRWSRQEVTEQHRRWAAASVWQETRKGWALLVAKVVEIRDLCAIKAWIQGFHRPAVVYSIAHHPSWWLPRMPTSRYSHLCGLLPHQARGDPCDQENMAEVMACHFQGQAEVMACHLQGQAEVMAYHSQGQVLKDTLALVLGACSHFLSFSDHPLPREPSCHAKRDYVWVPVLSKAHPLFLM